MDQAENEMDESNIICLKPTMSGADMSTFTYPEKLLNEVFMVLMLCLLLKVPNSFQITA